jgi:hypothetical protein
MHHIEHSRLLQQMGQPLIVAYGVVKLHILLWCKLLVLLQTLKVHV